MFARLYHTADGLIMIEEGYVLRGMALVAVTGVGLLPGQAPGRGKRTVTDAEVRRVHAGAILIDTHNDITSRTVAGLDIGAPHADTHTDLARMKRGGMGAQFFAVFVAASYTEGNRAANRTLEMIDTVKHDIVARYPRDFELATTAEDIRRIHREHKIAALMGIEGGHAIEDSLRLVRSFYDLGVRYMTLTHANSNHWADSSGDPNQPNHGLSGFGKDVVREMNRLGMIVDISHVSDKTFWDVLETSEAPVFASHSSCRAVTDVPRNMTDEMIVALAKKGGVIQINFACEFLNPDAAAGAEARNEKLRPMLAELRRKYATDPEGREKAEEEARRSVADPRIHATLADVVKHINHVVDIAGIDAVGLGSDFDGVDCVPDELNGVDKWPNLTRALLEEGYTRADIFKIYGENTLRIMTQVERVAASLQSKGK